MKWALLAFGPIGVGAGRVLCGAAVLWLMWLLRRKSRWPLVWVDLPALALLIAIAFCIPFCVQPYVLGLVEATAGHGSAFVGLVIVFVPLFTVIVSIPLLRVYPTKLQLVGIIGGLLFIALLFADEVLHNVPLRYLLLGLVPPFCYSLGNTYIKRRFQHVPPMVLALAALSATGLVLTPLSAAVETVTVDARFWQAAAALAVLGVVCTGLATHWFYTLIQRRGPLYAGMVTYIVPCLAIFIAWLDAERITGGQIVAILGVLAMVALVQYRPPAARTAPVEPEPLERGSTEV